MPRSVASCVHPAEPTPLAALRLCAAQLHWRCAAPLSLPLLPEAQLTAWLLRQAPEFAHEAPQREFWIRVPRSTQVDFRKGDPLVFGLVWRNSPATQEGIERLLARLAAGQHAAQAYDAAMPLQAQLALERVECALSGNAIRTIDQVRAFGLDDLLATEAAQWLRVQPLWRWQWTSPARLLKRGAGRPRLGEARFVHDESGIDVAGLWQRLLSTLTALNIEAPEPLPEPPCQLVAQEHFWVQAHYRAADGSRKPVGGLLGEALLQWPQPPANSALGLLLLGGWLGIGQRRSFGLGQYQLLPATAPGAPAPHGLLPQLAEPGRWQRAFEHVRAQQPARNPQADRPFDPERAARAAARLCTATAAPPEPLQPVDLPKPDGGVRTLLVPPFWERVSQRVVLDAIAPQLDALSSDASYGFRAGRSREQARDRLLALAAAGHVWVLESDVEDFFDSVDPWRLQVRLRALFGGDPLVERIVGWITAPLRHPDGRLETRRRGLPQGSPLSPALSNLLLADLDHDIEAAGFALVRFADDFVIACKDQAQAEAALSVVRDSLAEKGLVLKAAKTRIVRFADGFDFLGYRFVHGLALPLPRAVPRLPVPSTPALATALAVTPDVLAADAPLALWRTPATSGPPVEEEVQATAQHPSAAPATAHPAAALGEYLVLAGPPHKLRRAQGQWQVYALTGEQEARAPVLRFPGERLAGILLAGVQHVSTGALHYALELGIPLHFIASNGRYRGQLWALGAGVDSALWQAQFACFEDAARALTIARELVSARIAGQRQILREQDHEALEAAGLSLLRAVREVPTLERLRGLEGQAAALYFQALKTRLPAHWLFEGRERRPPRDPFNSLLSLGYSVLTSLAQTWVHALALCPSSAPYHVTHGQRPALALDLIEPLRHRIEAVALKQLQQARRQPEDFAPRPGGGLILLPEARRDYLKAVLDALGRRTVMHLPLADDQTFPVGGSADDWLRQTLWMLIAHVRGKGEFMLVRPR